MCNVVYMFQRDSKVNVNYAGALFTIPRKRYFVCVSGYGVGGCNNVHMHDRTYVMLRCGWFWI